MTSDVLPELAGRVGWAVVQTVRSPLLVLDPDLRVLVANRAFCETYGLTEDAVEGALLFEIGGGQWDVPTLHETLQRVLPEDREIRDVEVRTHLAGLGTRVMLANARQVTSQETGDRPLILLSLEDRTKQEALETEIEEQMRLLKRSNRNLEQFAHAASHDLQEPLRKIGTYVHRLRSSLHETSLEEREVRYLDRMDQAVERLRGRIDDLLRLSRISRARPQMAELDLNDLVEPVVDDMGPAVEAADAEIEVGSLPVVVGDPSLLPTVFQNQISNALKFHREGEPPRVRIREETPSGEGRRQGVRIVVEDEGIGFEPEYAERIFQPFERLHGVGEYPGSGIGLALCRRVMEHHGGKITAEPREKGGARFVLVFPPAMTGGAP